MKRPQLPADYEYIDKSQAAEVNTAVVLMRSYLLG